MRGGLRGVGTRVGLAGLALLLVGSSGGCVTFPPTPPDDQPPELARRGGVLTLFDEGTVATWDPQSLADPRDTALAQRLFLRTLTAYLPVPAGDVAGPGLDSAQLVGDLATSPGRSDDGGRTWSFTLRRGALWQDGQQVTCADVRYGVSRSFERSRPEGTRYAMGLLDVPRHESGPLAGDPVYGGPGDSAHQAGFDAAITCSDLDVTFHLRQVVADFPDVVSLPEFAPYRKDIDTRTEDRLTVFSNGPYIVEGVWHPGVGGKLTRNYRWQVLSDLVREANPDTVRYVEGVLAPDQVRRVAASEGEDAMAIALAAVPDGDQSGVLSGAAADRTALVTDGVDEALVVRAGTSPLADPVVRLAFAVSASRAGYVRGGGGPTALRATTALVPEEVSAGTAADPLQVPDEGDPERARGLLRSAGIREPVPVRVAVAEDSGREAALLAMVDTWARAGFAVSIVPVTRAEADLLRGPGSRGDVDVVLVRHRLDRRSGAAVVPAFAAATALGRDDPDVGTAVAAAAQILDRGAREHAWVEVSDLLVGAGDVIALARPGRRSCGAARSSGSPWIPLRRPPTWP
jgi:peptide/nickel transport system substrate-binding protein